MNVIDLFMYFKFYKKKIYLTFLKKFKGLDYVGRYEEKNIELRGYEGCYPIKRLLRKLDISNYDKILDIGCGKGLFLYYAKDYKFAQIDGLEYSKALKDCAENNLKKLNDDRIKVFNIDAREFDEYLNYNYFFINNPFSANIMENVVEKIKKSYLENKRRIVIIYQFPFSVEVFFNNGFSLIFEDFPNAILTLEV